jgi:hypothetical protein
MGATESKTMARVSLYHGSDEPIERPDIQHNTGFADLGRGFYLTDQHDVARQRAYLRSRGMRKEAGYISAFEFDADAVTWVTWGVDGPQGEATADAPFGLRFNESPAGIAAWANYIKACRHGHTEVPGFGNPAVVRAWIATDEIEMVCSGFATAEEMAELFKPANLTVQYCLLDQRLIDDALHFVEAERIAF